MTRSTLHFPELAGIALESYAGIISGEKAPVARAVGGTESAPKGSWNQSLCLLAGSPLGVLWYSSSPVLKPDLEGRAWMGRERKREKGKERKDIF